MNAATTHPSITHPEWLRPEQAAKMIGVSRALLYDWMKRGWIKNSSIRPRGKIRGTRLVNTESLLAFVEDHSNAATAEKTGAPVAKPLRDILDDLPIP